MSPTTRARRSPEYTGSADSDEMISPLTLPGVDCAPAASWRMPGSLVSLVNFPLLSLFLPLRIPPPDVQVWPAQPSSSLLTSELEARKWFFERNRNLTENGLFRNYFIFFSRVHGRNRVVTDSRGQ